MMKLLGKSAAVLSASVIMATVGCLVSLPAVSQAASAQEQLIDAAGNMHIPENYRTTYEFLGSWSVAGDEGAQRNAHCLRLARNCGGLSRYGQVSRRFDSGEGGLSHSYLGYDYGDGQSCKTTSRAGS